MSIEVKSILVVDDEESIRDIISEYLRPQGYRVFLASGSAQAFEIIQSEENIDLLLTDMSMPDIDGVALSGVARDIRPSIRVVYMTGKTDGYLSRENVLPPHSSVLRKPFFFDDLMKVIRD